MRPVVNLPSKRTLDTIRHELTTTGQARCNVDELRVEASEWRALARKAAWELGRPVQTIEAGDQVIAVLKDWPRDEAEKAVTVAAMRRTIRAMESPNFYRD